MALGPNSYNIEVGANPNPIKPVILFVSSYLKPVFLLLHPKAMLGTISTLPLLDNAENVSNENTPFAVEGVV